MDDKSYPNSLYYKYDSTTKKVAELGEKKKKEKMGWKTQAAASPPASVLGTGTYELLGYEIKAKDSSSGLFLL